MAVAVAHSQGLFDYDEKVTTYWPEFAQHGKGDITVRQLLSHQAGLCAIDEPVGLKELADLDELAAILAAQKPAWEPGTKHGYHGMTLGWYEGELIRRVDPNHRSLGQFFQNEIAEPLELEFYIGLPPDVLGTRIATIKDWHPLQMVFHLNKMPWGFVKAFLKKDSLTQRAFSNPPTDRPGDFAKGEFLSVEIPAGNGIGQVRSIAKAYSVFATGGTELNLSEKTIEALTMPATPPSSGLHDEVLQTETLFSLGCMKPFPDFSFGSSSKAFGTPGAGGSFAFADPDAQVSFAYGMNRMGFYLWDDPREKALRDALYICLQKSGEGAYVAV